MLTNIVVKQTYVGNGIQTVFPIPFAIIVNGSNETKVYLRNENVNPDTVTLQTEGVNYTLTGGTPPTDVTMTIAPPTGNKLIVTRILPLTQIVDYLSTSEFPADSHELTVDRAVAMIQQLAENLTRVPQLSPGTVNPQPNMPEPVVDTIWGWDPTGLVVRYWTPAEVASFAIGTVLLRANNLSDLQSVSTALDNLGIDPFRLTANQSMDNNQAVNTNITNLLIQGAAYTSAVIYYQVHRATATDSKIAVGRLFVYRQPHTGNWAFDIGEWYGQDAVNPGGLVFNLQQVGVDAQIRYTSDNLLGAAYAGTIKTSVKFFKV